MTKTLPLGSCSDCGKLMQKLTYGPGRKCNILMVDGLRVDMDIPADFGTIVCHHCGTEYGCPIISVALQDLLFSKLERALSQAKDFVAKQKSELIQSLIDNGENPDEYF